jgi:hypothetical protein
MGRDGFSGQLAPQELEIEKIEAITRNLREGDQDDKEFERRLKVAQTLLKEKEVASRANDSKRVPTTNQPDQRSVQRPVQPTGGFGGQGGGFGGQTQ